MTEDDKARVRQVIDTLSNCGETERAFQQCQDQAASLRACLARADKVALMLAEYKTALTMQCEETETAEQRAKQAEGERAIVAANYVQQEKIVAGLRQRAEQAEADLEKMREHNGRMLRNRYDMNNQELHQRLAEAEVQIIPVADRERALELAIEFARYGGDGSEARRLLRLEP